MTSLCLFFLLFLVEFLVILLVSLFLLLINKEYFKNYSGWTLAKIPIKDNNMKSLKSGITQPCGIVIRLKSVIDKEK